MKDLFIFMYERMLSLIESNKGYYEALEYIHGRFECGCVELDKDDKRKCQSCTADAALSKNGR